MGKWLAVGGIALIAALLLMWKQVSSSSAEPPPPALATTKVEKAAPVASAAPAQPANKLDEELPVDETPKKLEKASDEFFYAFTEKVPKVLSKDAAECYAGKLGTKNRNAKLVLNFNVKVRSGKVRVEDVKVAMSTLNDPALESCFIQKVARSGWEDPSLPDEDWPDELVIRPERGLKKYVKENVEYVGDETHKMTVPPAPAPRT